MIENQTGWLVIGSLGVFVLEIRVPSWHKTCQRVRSAVGRAQTKLYSGFHRHDHRAPSIQIPQPSLNIVPIMRIQMQF